MRECRLNCVHCSILSAASHRPASGSPTTLSNGANSKRLANVSPDSAYHATTLEVARVGRHVYCEKPLATNFAEADEMMKAASDARLVAMVNLTYRT